MAELQKNIFLRSEGDAWFRRNRAALAAKRYPDDDAVLQEILPLLSETPPGRRLRVLEIGCGEGGRLAWLAGQGLADCCGVDPSAEAVAAAAARGVQAVQAVADRLPFEDDSFDLVLFGFCLYLCDRCDLFRIAAEADRVLRSPGWLVIQDFYSADQRTRAYHHRPGITSYKMDYRRLFLWHPDYECLTHKVRGHQDGRHTDLPDEWTAVSVLRKLRREPGTAGAL